MNSPENLALKIKEEAIRLGFDACGTARAGFLENENRYLNDYINENRNAVMNYLARSRKKRTDPRLVLENARSVISVILNYFPEKQQNPECSYKVSKYAYGQDYHKVIKTRLEQLLSFINQQAGNVKSKINVDSSPVMDKAWANRSGLGWTGKNTLLINKNRGSYFFIGEIITDIELDYDNPVEEHCGNCTRCINACPTGALVAPYRLDAAKCIAYATIEKEQFDHDLLKNNKEWIYGCDICQDVCPWNNDPKPSTAREFQINPFIEKAGDIDWEEIDEASFKKIFKNSPLQRRGFLKIRANINKVKNLGI